MSKDKYINWYGKGRVQTWTTPRDFFDKLHAKYQFTLDGAADEHNALLPRASTAFHPLPWNGERVFCNPPWSDIQSFVNLAPYADLAVLLVPARTNSKWFWNALNTGARVRFFLGRLKFGTAKYCSPVDCLLLEFTNGPTS